MTAEGSTASVAIQPEMVSFEGVLVGATATRQINLINQSNCHVKYTLSYSNDGQRASNTLQLSPASGKIPASGTQTVDIHFTPLSHNFFSFNLKCAIVSDEDEAVSSVSPMCEIVGLGIYPKLAILDARSDGIPNSVIWRKFSVPELNHELSSDLTDTEVFKKKFFFTDYFL